MKTILGALAWALSQVRHTPFNHDYVADERACVDCKALSKAKAILKAAKHGKAREVGDG